MRWFLFITAAMAAIGPMEVLGAEKADKPAVAPPTVFIPAVKEPAYRIAGDEFVRLWEKVTGQKLIIQQAEPNQKTLPAGDVVMIGSDAVQSALHELIKTGALESLDIAYGGDGYRILTLKRDAGRCLILAGGCGRSTLYAVYDFFRRQAGAEYFWDGDNIPQRAQIAWDGLDIREAPRFSYRGLRYFAHRGLHRFQAEQWDLEDWKREIDWLVKKRFNLFMLRTGIDDLFQRAFPGEVPYPPTDGVDPDAKLRSYDDRTSFWPLKYRGELRKQVLQYARDRGLIHPEDTGTITHWYSHTPSSFYKAKPNFPVIHDQKTGYSAASHAIWDTEAEVTWDTYWQLTATHIREFGSPQMFHTIGMAERTFGKTDRENLQAKLYVYRKTQEKLRQHYPDAPMLVASWDLAGWWKSPDVQRLLAELDPQRTILLDYTADSASSVTYRDWDVLGRFPWIYGIFNGYARNSDIHEDYGLLKERLRDAARDAKCLGMVMWSEISHNDTFLLEYLADNSWQPDRIDLDAAVARYCRTRYAAAMAEAMRTVWSDILVASQSVQWSMRGPRWASFGEPQFRTLTSGILFASPAVRTEYDRVAPTLAATPGALERLAGMAGENYDNPLWRRDALDMSRTVANRALFVALARAALDREAWRRENASAERLRKLSRISQDLMAALAGTLALSDDFSMQAGLQRLGQAKELGGVSPTVNPHSEYTLKGNSENDYCRSHHYELVERVYRPELAAYWKWVLARIDSGERTKPWQRPKEFGVQEKTIVDAFYDTPLAAMAPTAPRDALTLAKELRRMESLVKELVQITTN